MKSKTQIKVYKVVTGVLCLALVVGISVAVKAYSGTTSGVVENATNVYFQDSTQRGAMLGGTYDSEPDDLSYSDDWTAVNSRYIYGKMEVNEEAYFDGAVDMDSTLTVAGNTTFSGQLNSLFSNEAITAIATNTLLVAESGKTIFLSTSTPHVLPATSTSAGVTYRFVVSAALTGTSTIVTSDGSNAIQGVIDVNSTMVDCDAEDTITVGGSVENVGDWFELSGDGTYWYVSGQALNAGQFACTAT